jgi:phage anti-repressor protein
MFNSTVDFYISVGAQAIQGGNKELALNTNFNPENAEYRKSVFPRYSAFMREVFSAENAGEITRTERITIFSEVKDKAISKIVSARNIALVNQTEVNSEVEQLRIELAKALAEVNSLTRANDHLNTELASVKTSIRSLVLNNVVTKTLMSVVAK